jgi:hypothetical protein
MHVYLGNNEMLLIKEIGKVKKELLDVIENIFKENTFKNHSKSNNQYINRNHIY